MSILLLKVSAAIAEMNVHIAVANKELASGGWLVDWEKIFNDDKRNIDYCIQQALEYGQ